MLKPVAVFPKHAGHGYYVLCSTYYLNPEINDNGKEYDYTQQAAQHNANEIFKQYKHEKPWYGLEQEYFINPGEDTERKLQGKYYCGVGNGSCLYRKIVEEHMEQCLKCGINISGINEVAPNQWEFQVGPVEGIHAANHLLMARYLLVKIGEEYK